MKNIVKTVASLALILPTLILAEILHTGDTGGHGGNGAPGGDGYLFGGAGGNGGPGAPAKVIYNDSSRGSHSGNDNGNSVHTNTRTKGR